MRKGLFAFWCGMPLVMIGFAFAEPSAQAGAREQAYRLYSRVAGVPPSDAELTQMTSLIQAGQARDAAKVATSSFQFYNLSLVRFAKPLSGRDESPRPAAGTESTRVPLNDYVATVVGMVRDNVPFDQALYGDIIYKGVDGLAGVTAYAMNSNDHYKKLGDLIGSIGTGLDLRSPTVLEKRKQSDLRPTGFPDIAGLLTTRQYGLAYFSAGTNRRVTRYAFKSFLCNDTENVADATAPDTRIRKDVDRAPTGDSRIFLTTCKGCHAGLDGLSGAFAHFDFPNDQLEYATTVQSKMTKNAIFAGGYQTVDDSWLNFWLNGQNARLGWRGAGTGAGNGAKSLGQVLAATRAFSTCMVKRAFKLVCLRDATADDDAAVNQVADHFESGGTYNLRDAIEETAVLPQCLGR